jgi:hypothetical protein
LGQIRRAISNPSPQFVRLCFAGFCLWLYRQAHSRTLHHVI